ncbi:MAG: coenzyme F420-0:L-glutamate ligase [Promethearchaeota archaeon]
MSEHINLIGLKGIPKIKPGDNLANIIIDSIGKSNTILEDGDILVIAQSIVSKSCGFLVDLSKIEPSDYANMLYEGMKPLAAKENIPIKDPQLIQLILDESNELVRSSHVMIVETKHGFICANAGIDRSNVEGDNMVTLLPENPDEEAKKIKDDLKNLVHINIAIIISDSFGRPFRRGAIGVAIGLSGIDAVLDNRGKYDLYGKELKSTIVGQADNLASAAQLIMGEADEGFPIILIKGYDFEINNQASINSIIRERKSDLFREKESDKDILEILKSRRSYKLDFSSREVDEELIRECIDLSRWAPSAHNGQFWRYIIMRKGVKRSQLIDRMNEKFKTDLTNEGKSESTIRFKIEKTRNQFLNSPFLILLCLDKQDLEVYEDVERNLNELFMGIQSISSSATYLLLAFETKKLSSCWYCAPLFAKKIIQKELNLPETYIPMAFFTVGYPKDVPKAPSRKNLDDILFKIKD